MGRRSALRRARLRVSEADRDLVAERLHTATVEGRLLTQELDERLGVALAARTYGELAPLVADLPGPRGAGPQESRASLRMLVALVITIILAAIGIIVWQRW
jgi:Domain of unknown function (DUF1707)